MYKAELYSIGKTRDGKYIVHLLVGYHGIEEECIFRYDRLTEIPRYLIRIKYGKVKFNKGLQVWVSQWCGEGSNGEQVFEQLHEKNPDCECDKVA